MKVLVIIGSLRKSNTYKTVKKIEEYHKKNSEIEYEYIFLKDIDFQQCRGCFACISYGENRCPIKDDRDLIINKIESSDGVILASPNYVMNVPWITKNFIDRFAYIMHRPKYFNQYFMILITSGSYMGAKQACKALEVMASGGKVVNKLIVYNSPGMNKHKINKQEKKIIKEAKSFSNKLSRKKTHRPPFGFLVWFSVFKASSSENRSQSQADYEFYKDKDYFIDIPLNFFQRITISFFTGFFRKLIRMGFV